MDLHPLWTLVAFYFLNLLGSVVFFNYFFLIRIVGGGVHKEVHAALRPYIGLLYLSRVLVWMEKLVE
jgi:hypothetical protein